MSVKFSIVTPVYNAEKYVARTVESVLAQTHCDWEHICVDDGSKDSSGAILDGFAAKDKRIKVIHQSNGGEGAARNSALKVATGDWIVFLDADDLLSPWALTEHAKIASMCPKALMTRLDMVQFDGDNDPDWNEFHGADANSIGVADIKDAIPLGMSVTHFFQFAYKRTLVLGLRFTDHYVGADRIFLMKCLIRTDFVVCGVLMGYGYRQSSTSIMGSPMTLRKLRHLQVYIKECIDSVESYGRKRLAMDAMREFGNLLTERAVYDIGRLQKAEQGEAWHLWQSWLPWMSTLERLTMWRRFTIVASRLLFWVPFHFVPRVLCELPLRLKLKGFHR